MQLGAFSVSLNVRDIKKNLKASNIKLLSEADEAGEGPASLTTDDPDGNITLLEQHH